MRKIGKDGVFSIQDGGKVSCKGYIVEGAATEDWVKADGTTGTPPVGVSGSTSLTYLSHFTDSNLDPFVSNHIYKTIDANDGQMKLGIDTSFDRLDIKTMKFTQRGTGKLTLVSGNGNPSLISLNGKTQTAGQHAVITCTWTMEDEIVISGDLI